MALTLTTSFPDLTERLDRVEAALPPLPSRTLHLQRELAAAFYDTVAGAFGTIVDASKSVANVAAVSARTVIGQGRAGVADVAENARTTTRQVAGQAKAQARRVGAVIEDEAVGVVDSAIHAVEDQPGTGTPYEQWTKPQLQQRARELGISSTSRMNKPELVAALRSA